MTYAYDNYVQYPVADLYDSAIMQMAISAARDMYDKGQEQMKDFYKTYGDFISPFAKDMERYGQMIGGVRDIINSAYANGIDLLKSPEGRMLLSKVTNSINPAEFNMMRANAKTGYAYLEAAQKLRSQGKYSEAQELFDIAQNNGINFRDFSTLGESGLNTWDRTSPIEAASLQDLTKSGYQGRQARLLSAADFEDERLKGKYQYDPKYEWSGYLYSDLLKGAPGAILSNSADPRMQYFRHLAEQKVAASGQPYTQADVEAQFQRDVADANTWALIDPTRKANEFALDDHRTNNDIRATGAREAIQHRYWELQHGYDLDGDGAVSNDERKKVATMLMNKNKDEESSYLQDQFDKGRHAYITGEAGNNLTAEQLEKDSKLFAKQSFQDTKALRYATTKENWQKEKNKYLAYKTKRGILDPTALASYREPVKDMTDAVYIRPGDINKIVNSDELVSRTYGGARRGKERFNTDRSTLTNIGSDNIKMQFTDETYTAPLRYNSGIRSEQRQRVRLYRDVDVTENGKTITKTEEIPGDWWFLVQAGDYHRGTYTTSGSDVITYAPSGVSNIWSDESMGEMEPYDRAVNKAVGRKAIKDYE